MIMAGVCSVMSYTLLLSLIEYKTLVLRGDFQRAQEVLPTIPIEHLNRYDILANLYGTRDEILSHI
jgi:coatomer subunit beta'